MPQLALPAAPPRSPFLAATEGQIKGGVDAGAAETCVSQVHDGPDVST